MIKKEEEDNFTSFCTIIKLGTLVFLIFYTVVDMIVFFFFFWLESCSLVDIIDISLISYSY